MRILITGASGFIGSTLADYALAKGWEVTAAVRSSSSRAFLQDARIKLLQLSFENKTALHNELLRAGRFDFIVHGAGATKALRREDYFKANAEITRHFADVLQSPALTPHRFLFLSSLAAKGPADENIHRVYPGKESQPVTSYGASKLKAEQHLDTLTGFPWISIQPTAVFGPRDRDVLSFLRLVNMGLELYIGTTPQRVSFIYVKDLAELIFAALERGQNGRRYIASDNRDYTTDDLGVAARTALDRRTLRVRLPLGIVRMVAGVSETLGRWQGRMPVLNVEKLQEIARVSWWCDAGQTLEELQIIPEYDLFSGMQETVDWYKAQGWL